MTGFRLAPLTIAAAILFALAGCRKQKTTLDQLPPPPPVDTTFRKAEPLASIDTTDEAVFREAELEAELQRKVAEILLPVYFEFNSYRLTQNTIERLVRVASFLTEYGTLRVLAEGHCDERGSSEYNMGLGENRARAVKEYLVNYGVPGIRVETTSYGEERLARAGCGDEECHGMNRRVEFTVIGR